MSNLSRGLLYFIIFICSPSIYAQSTWTINKYKIVQQAPGEKRHSIQKEADLQKQRDEDFSGKILGLRTSQIRDIELYLENVGNEYKKLGFKEPSITTKTKSNDAYEVFFYDYDDANPTAYYSQGYSVSAIVKEVTHIRNSLSIDSSRALPKSNNFNLTSKVYEDLAHELFHAIQKSYPLFSSHSDLGDWIVEGTATAIGEDVALKLGKLDVVETWGSSEGAPMHRWGLRTYSNTLWVPDLGRKASPLYSVQEGHRTSGFWRFIGEYISSGRKPGAHQVKAPSYRYLASLFNGRIYGKTNDHIELDWLDTFLKKKDGHVGNGLVVIYPYFITAFTHYASTRMGLQNQKAIKAWQKCLFTTGLDCRKTSDLTSDQEGCDVVILDKGATEKETALIDFRPVSARCIKVVYPEVVTLDLTIHIESDDENIVKSIKRIGIQTQNKKIKVLVSTDAKSLDGKYFGEWVFQNVLFQKKMRSGQNSVVFIVSNIAQFASQTAESPSVKFKFTYAMSTTNLQLSK